MENIRNWMLKNSTTRLYEMSAADLWSFRQKTDRVKSFEGKISPWKTIPSTTKFEISLNEMNIILEQIGIFRRLEGDKTFGEAPHRNKRMNQYMRFQLSRLYKSLILGNYKEFFNRCTYLIRNSVAFRTSALNRCFPRWYKNMPFSFIINVNTKVNKILDENSTELEFKRVYIPKTAKDEEILKEVDGDHRAFKKAGGKWRPLGVPQFAWRVVLHMWTNFLVMFLEKHLGERQHGFIPGRGTLTAWRALTAKMHKYDYIMEIDLTNCFGEVQANAVSEILKEYGAPEDVVKYIEKINLCTPKWHKEDLLDESPTRKKEILKAKTEAPNLAEMLMMQALNMISPGEEIKNKETNLNSFDVDAITKALQNTLDNEAEKVSETERKYKESQAEWKAELAKQEKIVEEGEEPEASMAQTRINAIKYSMFKEGTDGVIEYSDAFEYKRLGVSRLNSHKGLPQGANWSPILTAAVLRDFVNQCEDAVFYADDGLFFSNKPIELKEDEHKGIFINYKKRSGYVKYNGKFTKDFIFLGLKYNHKTDMISGHTHKGSRLEVDSRRQDLFDVLESLRPSKHYNKTKWDLLFSSSIGGTVMSKMYNATWEQLEYLIQWKPEGVKGSWLHLKERLDNYRTTSSDACFALSQVISDSTQAMYANRTKAKVMELKPGSESDKIMTLRQELGQGNWRGEHKQSSRAMFVKGRWIRKKVLETMDVPESLVDYAKIMMATKTALDEVTKLKGEINNILIKGYTSRRLKLVSESWESRGVETSGGNWKE